MDMEDKIVDTGKKCPLCGGSILTHNDPSDDPYMTEWCSSNECRWFQNQFIDWNDMKDIAEEGDIQ